MQQPWLSYLSFSSEWLLFCVSIANIGGDIRRYGSDFQNWMKPRSAPRSGRVGSFPTSSSAVRLCVGGSKQNVKCFANFNKGLGFNHNCRMLYSDFVFGSSRRNCKAVRLNHLFQVVGVILEEEAFLSVRDTPDLDYIPSTTSIQSLSSSANIENVEVSSK